MLHRWQIRWWWWAVNGSGQLVAALSLRDVRRADQSDVAEKLHGAVDRDEH